MKLIDLSGQRFVRLLVVSLNPERGKSGAARWDCVCDCGCAVTVLANNLKRGNSRSCGCLDREMASKRVTTHGLTKHPLHNVWRCMLYRCSNSKDIDYGGRGVVVCEEWENDFISFYNWAISNGWAKGLQLDKDIKAKQLGLQPLLYSPERCQFVTAKQNSRNRRGNRLITCRGMTKTLSEFAEMVGENSDIIHFRMRHGWSEEDAIFTPFKRDNKNEKRRK